MSDSELTAWLDDLGERVPHVEAPLADVVRVGRDATGRRRRRVGSALVAAVAVSVAVVSLGPSLVVQQGEIDPGLGPVTAAASPVPPDGMRLVGSDGVVIAVPEDWVSIREPRCGVVNIPSYFIGEPPDPTLRCPSFGRGLQEAPHLRITARGTPVRDCFEVFCPDRRFDLDGVLFEVWTPPGTTDPIALLEQMASSVQRLPDGWGTVPLWPTEVTTTGCCRTHSGPISEADYLGLLAEAGLTGSVDVLDVAQGVTVPAPGEVVRRDVPSESADDGPRLVGAGGVQVALPRNWLPSEPPICGSALAAKYYFVEAGADLHAECPSPPPDYVPASPTVAISSTGETAAPHGFSPGANGVPDCQDDVCVAVLRLYGYDTAFTVVGTPQQIEELRATIQPVPEGSTTVPARPWEEVHPLPNETTFAPVALDAYLDLIEAAGLRPTTGIYTPKDLADADVAPGPGTVVPLGSEVLVQAE